MSQSNNIQRIGFACKWIDHAGQVEGLKPRDDARQYNTGTTTVAWLNRQNRNTAEQKLWDLALANIESSRRLVERVGSLDPALRMLRLSSDILPVYTEPSWSYFYQQTDVRDQLASKFAAVGDLARDRNVRLSFHPGQFCVLASDNPDTVNRSIEEFEYHVDMARWMGYGKKFQDIKINVHISGRQGPAGIISVLNRLSPEARNTITIENDEISWGLEASLELSGHLGLVLDIHHHWVKTGEYIQADDPRIQQVIDSWRGERPVIHYSVSREEHLPNEDVNTRPCLTTLMEAGHKRQKLRAHSDFYWNRAVNDWALTHWSWADIMCESKAKNLASHELYKQAGKQNV